MKPLKVYYIVYESKHSADEITQINVHSVIYEEDVSKKNYFWSKCKKINRIIIELLNDHLFIDVKGGHKTNRPWIVGPTKICSIIMNKNQKNNFHILSNPIMRPKRQDTKARLR